jgi:phosphoribosylanthranilate isomerase
MIGLMFFPGSPRAISLAQAAAIAAALSPEVIPVGVFVNPASALVKEAIAAGALKALQFHGDEPPDFCTQFGLMSIKAFRVRDANSLRVLPETRLDAGCWSIHTGQPGRSEKCHLGPGPAARFMAVPFFWRAG